MFIGNIETGIKQGKILGIRKADRTESKGHTGHVLCLAVTSDNKYLVRTVWLECHLNWIVWPDNNNIIPQAELLKYYFQAWKLESEGSRIGTVLRAFIFQQCGLGLIPVLHVIDHFYCSCVVMCNQTLILASLWLNYSFEF